MFKFYKFFALFLVIFLSGCATIQIPSLSVNQPASELSAPEQIREEITVPIIVYHHISDEHPTIAEADRNYTVTVANFQAQMDYLSERKFTPILFGDIAKYFAGDFKLPDKPVVIAFDDGAIDQYQNAWPIFSGHKFKATFFIFTNPIGKNSNYLTWEQINEFVAAGSEVGVHGHYHLFWDEISGDELAQEIVSTKKLIEEQTGQKVTAAAYPFGQYDDRTVQALKDAGYSAARGIVNGQTHRSEDLFWLKSYFITNNFSRFKNIVGD
jgi:peptidoglycan/xylan/chitin deacetylase (PgdA/CDA1 family)